ncbi:MAG: DUF4174 domain-containing protein [Pseudomonadota bacterium]
MSRYFTLCFLALTVAFGLSQPAQSTDGSEPADIVLPGESVNLSEFVWIKRPLIVFADSPADPRFIEQMAYINARLDDLDARDVIVLIDTDPSTKSDLRIALRPRGFMLALIGKDGDVKLRKPRPWDVREISRTIDKMPTRQQEIRDRRGDS